MIRAVIFDWAGTTIDYGCFAPLKGFIDGFAAKGIKITNSEARAPMGMLKLDHTRAIAQMPRVRTAYERLHGVPPDETAVREIYEVFEGTLMRNLLDYTTLKPFVRETVDALRAKGLKIGSTTGYTRAMMERIIARVAEQGYRPDCCICADEVAHGRPAPDMIERNLAVFGISNPKEAVKVGDTVSDIKEGKNAGCWSVGVILGSSELGLKEQEVREMPAQELKARCAQVREVFLRAGADAVLSDFSELSDAIAKFGG